MIKRIYIITLYLSTIVGYLPRLNMTDEVIIESGLRSNGVIDITTLSDSSIAIGTGNGIGIGTFRDDKLILTNLYSLNLPQGGFPSVVSNNGFIAVSGVDDTLIFGDSLPKGTGISYSFDLGESWQYFSQPKDPLPDVLSCPYSSNPNKYYQTSDSLLCEQECVYPFSCNEPEKNCVKIFDWISWGSQDSIRHLSTTVDIWNVSYNMSISDDYLYAASFTGGLRRLELSDTANGDWEVVPLPMDNQQYLFCDQLDSIDYEYDVNDSCPINNNPCNDLNSNKCNPYLSGNMNHKVYSVYSIEDTLWVGTADGINKGVVNGDCIDWLHFNSDNSNLSGDWVVGFTTQETDGNQFIYAVTWPTNEGEYSSISYSNNGGLLWEPVEQFKDYGIKVYELDADNARVYAATDKGLYVSDNGQYWEKFQRPVGNDGQQILSDKIYSVKSFDDGSKLIVGSDDGLAVTYDNGLSWDVYRSWEKNQSEEEILFNPYPNPFYRKYSNTVGNNGYVRFIIYDNNPGSNNTSIDIYNFSMDKVVSLNSPVIVDDGIEFIWDGLNNYSMPVPNGTYFCRLNHKNKYSWTKLVVVN